MNTLMKQISTGGVNGSSNRHKAFNAIALLLVFCIADVYLLAGNRASHFEVNRDAVTKPNTPARDAAKNVAPNKILLGRLFVPYHQEILVNGHSAMSGDIIISGSRLKNTAVDPVKVEIGSIANLAIESNADLLLTFDQTNVGVRVAAGTAILSTTSDGIKGEVIMPDGEVCPSNCIAKEGSSIDPQSEAQNAKAAAENNAKAAKNNAEAAKNNAKAAKNNAKAAQDSATAAQEAATAAQQAAEYAKKAGDPAKVTAAQQAATDAQTAATAAQTAATAAKDAATAAQKAKKENDAAGAQKAADKADVNAKKAAKKAKDAGVKDVKDKSDAGSGDSGWAVAAAAAADGAAWIAAWRTRRCRQPETVSPISLANLC